MSDRPAAAVSWVTGAELQGLWMSPIILVTSKSFCCYEQNIMKKPMNCNKHNEKVLNNILGRLPR